MNAPVADSRTLARGRLAETLLLSSDSRQRSRPIRPKPEAVALLSEIIARLHGVDMPVVQFINVSGESSAAAVTASFAQASAICLGRTLLVRLCRPEPQDGRTESALPVATPPRQRTRKAAAESIEIVPDSTVPGLCHAYVRRESAETSLEKFSSSENLLDCLTLDFKLIAIESLSPEGCPATLELATRCHGSVLLVTAGKTSLSQLRIVMRQVQLAGGTLMGSVLNDAPSAARLSVIPWFHKLVGKSRE